MKPLHAMLIAAMATVSQVMAQSVEPIKYGDMNQWITRDIKESAVIGGNHKLLYEIGPTATIAGNKPYITTASPWATSNVYAKVSGVTKGSNAVFPADRPGHGKCARLTTCLEKVKVLGIINMDVMVAGSVFLGRMHEPISSTKNPYAKMEVGMPFTKRPLALVLDYKLTLPANAKRIKASGFGKKKEMPGCDNATVFVALQRRWEEPDGTLHAKRIASGGEKFGKSTPSWVNDHHVKLIYGNAGHAPGYIPSLMALRSGSNAYYARNSKGRMMPVIEEGWDTATATPTHVIVMISSGDGEPYVGTEGTEFLIDNLAFAY